MITFPQFVFYVFSAILILAGAMVIMTRNPVKSILFLVLAFFAAAVLWMLMEAEFLALVLIFVYVGAVMTLFLFVVMMLNLDLVPLKAGFVKYFPIGIAAIILLLIMMFMVLGPKHFGLSQYGLPVLHSEHYSNIKQLGEVLYTNYAFAFEIAALILLVAIIAAISLALRGTRAKRQSIYKQHSVQAKDRYQLIDLREPKK